MIFRSSLCLNVVPSLIHPLKMGCGKKTLSEYVFSRKRGQLFLIASCFVLVTLEYQVLGHVEEASKDPDPKFKEPHENWTNIETSLENWNSLMLGNLDLNKKEKDGVINTSVDDLKKDLGNNSFNNPYAHNRNHSENIKTASNKSDLDWSYKIVGGVGILAAWIFRLYLDKKCRKNNRHSNCTPNNPVPSSENNTNSTDNNLSGIVLSDRNNESKIIKDLPPAYDTLFTNETEGVSAKPKINA